MTESRFAGVRAQLRTVRRAAAAGAVIAFAALAGLARESHPGTSVPAAGTGSGTTAPVTQTQSDDDGSSFFDFGSGAVGQSSGGVPQVQSGGS